MDNSSILLYKTAMLFGAQRKISAYHLAACKRRFALAPTVGNIGFLPGNTARVHAIHPQLNFVFLLRGHGHYATSGKSFNLTAPCAFVHIPELRIKSGPATQWDEIYISYPPRAMNHFTRTGLLDPKNPVWPITDLPAFENDMMNLRELLPRATEQGVPDMIDWLCAGLILKTRTPTQPPETLSALETALHAIRAHLEKHYREDIPLEALIRKYGLSETHFRRAWNKRFTCSPAHYIAALRIGEACRLLANPGLRIGDIAEQVGYKDVFHFSRRFHQMTGQSASAFRRGTDHGTPSKRVVAIPWKAL